MAQHEITKQTKLLDARGNVLEAGYCKRNLFVYNRENITANKARIKEWDFYQCSDGIWMVQLNFFNISLASALTASVVNLKTGESCSDLVPDPVTFSRNQLNRNGDKPYYFEYKKLGRQLMFDVREYERHLYFKGKANGKDLIIDLFAQKNPDDESITIVTPFNEKGHFFLTQKQNCMPTFGKVIYDGKTLVEFSKESAFTVMDWGRGVWPYSNMWYWANGSTYLDGKRFGFELTWGFGDDFNASETALFYDGKCHKIGRVHLEKDPEKEGWFTPWHFVSDDDRFDMVMKPFYDNNSNLLPLNLVGMNTHQLHGLWSGRAVLDDGTVLEIKDMYAFCEKVYNKW